MRAAAVLSLAVGAAGHGYLLDPPPRAAAKILGSPAGSAGSCAAGICVWFSEGCTIGCPKCTSWHEEPQSGPSCPSHQGNATLPHAARTLFLDNPDCGINPWCAPGTAPVRSPCGVSGGGPDQDNMNGGFPATGYPQGMDGVDLPELSSKTTWKTGDVVEVQWAFINNHGGGYQYRLCPKSSKTTEECFQKMPLEFHGDQQYIQWCPSPEQYPLGYGGAFNLPKKPFPACDPKNRTAIPAVKVSTGTYPHGTTWMRNPIPSSNCFGHSIDPPCPDGSHPSDFYFPPPGPDLTRPGKLLGGFGGGECFASPVAPFSVPGIPRDEADNTTLINICGAKAPLPPDSDPTAEELRGATLAHTFQWNLVDKLVVPAVPPGEYIMSLRYDCEMTSQVWSTCADITITP